MSGAFRTTIWTTIRRAGSGGSTAVNDLIAKYRMPVVAFIRNRGYSDEDAEDLTQEVFMVVVQGDLLAKVEKERGRFRSFLLGVVKNVLRNAERIRRAEKRGGGARPVSLDAPAGSGRKTPIGDLLQARNQDDTFDREWIRHLVERALAKLANESPKYVEVLRRHLEARKNYAQIGAELGLEVKQVDNLLQQAKRKLGELIRAEIREYCSSAGEYRDEVKYLRRFLGGS